MAIRLHKPLSHYINGAYDHADGTVHFDLFDGRTVTVTDYGNEYRINNFKSATYVPEQFLTAEELRAIMAADEDAANEGE